MSYLRGPLTPVETQQLAAVANPEIPPAAETAFGVAATVTTATRPSVTPATVSIQNGYPSRPPSIPTSRAPSSRRRSPRMGHPQSRRATAHRCAGATRTPPFPDRRGHGPHLQHQGQHRAGRSTGLAHRSGRRWKLESALGTGRDLIDLQMTTCCQNITGEGVFEPLPKGIGRPSRPTPSAKARSRHTSTTTAKSPLGMQIAQALQPAGRNANAPSWNAAARRSKRRKRQPTSRRTPEIRDQSRASRSENPQRRTGT